MARMSSGQTTRWRLWVRKMNSERRNINRQAPDAVQMIEAGQTVVDCGCYGWRLAEQCRLMGAQLIGVDQAVPPQIPEGVEFAMVRGLAIELDSDCADLVIASHILEHIQEPIAFMRELMRITRPGGLVWIEAPSELSAMTSASNEADDHSFSSFWDDPTHVRPWSPGAMYRLALSCQCMPVAIGRCDAGGIPSTRMVGRKPKDCHGVSPTRYVSLRNIEPGIENAWRHVWGNGDCQSDTSPIVQVAIDASQAQT